MASDPDRIVKQPEVTAISGLGRTKLWQLEKAGLFPKRVALGTRHVGWRLSEVQEWIRSLPHMEVSAGTGQ